MKVFLTSRETIKAKDGREFVKVYFLSAKDGVTGDLFMTKEKYEALALEDGSFLSSASLKGLLAEESSYEVEFDQRGRLVSVEPAE